MMKWNALEAALRQHAALGVLDSYGHVEDAVGSYPLLRLRTPGRGLCVITAGFHGDEQAGPIALARHLPDVVARARARDLGLVIYPCVNPSGFEACTRYNRNGERPNNDVLRYDLADGSIIDHMHAPVPFVGIHTQRGGPAETRALIADLVTLPTPEGALDLHQDPYFAGPLAYAYAFGDPAPYIALIAATAQHVPIARCYEVDDGVFSDPEGLIVLHDGSISDYFHRRGARHVAVVETTTDTAMDAACAVNRLWMLGFVDLAADAR